MKQQEEHPDDFVDLHLELRREIGLRNQSGKGK